MKPTLDASAYATSGPIITIPTQSINLVPQNSVVGIQIQQGKVAIQQPAPPLGTINVQRTPVTGSTVQYRVQFMRDPSNPSYAGTSVIIQTAVGTSALQATSGEGPIIFNAARSTSPTAIGIQTNTTSGNSSSSRFGTGNTNKLNLT